MDGEAVVIVGAGPAGLMLACELATAGQRPVVVERQPEIDGSAPAVALNAGGVELLQQRGLVDRLRATAYTAPLPRSHYALLPLDPARLGTRYENSLIVAQSDVERVLQERAEHLGARVVRGVEVTAVHDDGEQVRLDLRSEAGPSRITARFVVGCDGVDSVVRRGAGIGFSLQEWPFDGLVGDIEVPLRDLAPEHLGAYRSPYGDGVYMCLPLGPHVVRLITARFGVPPKDPGGEVTDAEVADVVEQLTGTPLPPATIRWMSRYRHRNGVADRYRRGNVLVAGDAAHVMFPLNGQACTTGLGDAVNLGWKLAAVVDGTVPETILDSYQTERQPVAHRACESVQAQVALSGDPGATSSLREVMGQLLALDQVNRFLLEQITGLDVRCMSGTADGAVRHPRAGLRLGPVSLTTGTGDVELDDLLRDGGGLLLDASATGGPVKAAGPWASRVRAVRLVAAPCEDATAALLRPDGHIAWASQGEDVAGLVGELRRWFGSPAGD